MAALLAGCAGTFRGAAPDFQAPEDIRSVIEHARDRVYPALVHIQVVFLRYFGGRETKEKAIGSGTIISPEGYVVTNQHVTNNGRLFRCILADRTELPARLVGEDPLTDLAVLKLDLAKLPPGQTLPVAALGDSSRLQVGELVMAMGSPFALSRSVTLGIVSNPERVFFDDMSLGSPDEMELEPGQQTGVFTRWIQHDAMIMPGSSGGPLVNLRGEIVGINELGGFGMGFAIPSHLARGVVEALIQKGEVSRSWIGVSFVPITGSGQSRGVLVDSVFQGGPADRAGLRAGDVLVRLDGQEITVRFPEEVPALAKRISELPVGATLEAAVLRDGAEQNVKLVTERLEQDRKKEECLRSWGLSVTDITRKLARELRLTSREGVLITALRPGGPAELAEPPLRPEDVIVAVDNAPVADLRALLERYQRLSQESQKPEPVVLAFRRGSKELLTLLRPRPEVLRPAPREVQKAWIGIETQPVLADLAERLYPPERVLRGFRIIRVFPGTRAAEAGLQVGDLIIGLDDEPVIPQTGADAGMLARRVRRHSIGDTVKVHLIRGKNLDLLDVPMLLEPTRVTPAEARRHRDPLWEITVRAVTFFDRAENRWSAEVRGVLVEEMERGGLAGLAGLERGDLIQHLGDRPIRGIRDFRESLEEYVKMCPERYRVIVMRGVRTRVLFAERERNLGETCGAPLPAKGAKNP